MRIDIELGTIVQRTAKAIDDGIHHVASSYSKMVKNVRASLDDLVFVDTEETIGLARLAVNPDTPIIHGMSAETLMPVLFTPDDVRHSAIRRSGDGHVIGVHFPSTTKDLKMDRYVDENTLATISSYVKKGRTYYRYTTPGPVAAAWDGRRTTVAEAHSLKLGYAVQVKRRIPFTKYSIWRRTLLSGEEYGRLLASDKYFRAAVKNAGMSDLLQLSCAPAKWAEAAGSAKSLRAAGIQFNVRASAEKVVVENSETPDGLTVLTNYGPTTPGPADSPWKTY